jgi:transcriptional regulator with XRE-family HTH domain
MPIRHLTASERQLRIREARRSHRISIDELAKRAGLERSRLWRGERGYIVLPDVELDAIEAVLGVVGP